MERQWLSKTLAVAIRENLANARSYRDSFINFIKELNRRGWAHCDLHSENLFIDSGKLYIQDWEVACRNEVVLPQAYDITGLGLEHSPLFPRGRTIFTYSPIAVGPIFNLKPSDFKLKRNNFYSI